MYALSCILTPFSRCTIHVFFVTYTLLDGGRGDDQGNSVSARQCEGQSRNAGVLLCRWFMFSDSFAMDSLAIQAQWLTATKRLGHSEIRARIGLWNAFINVNIYSCSCALA